MWSAHLRLNPLEGFISDDFRSGKRFPAKRQATRLKLRRRRFRVIEYEILSVEKISSKELTEDRQKVATRQNSGEQDLNQLRKIRREKLKTSQEEGKIRL